MPKQPPASPRSPGSEPSPRSAATSDFGTPLPAISRRKLALIFAVIGVAVIALLQLAMTSGIPTYLGMLLQAHPENEEREGIPTIMGWLAYYLLAIPSGAITGTLFGRRLLAPLSWGRWITRSITTMAAGMLIFCFVTFMLRMGAFAVSSGTYPSNFFSHDLLPWLYGAPLLAIIGLIADMGLILPLSIVATFIVRRICLRESPVDESTERRAWWKSTSLMPLLVLIAFGVSMANLIAFRSRVNDSLASREYVDSGTASLSMDTASIDKWSPEERSRIVRYLSASSAWLVTSPKDGGSCSAERVAYRRPGTLDGIGLGGSIGDPRESGMDLDISIGFGQYSGNRDGSMRGYHARPTVIRAGSAPSEIGLRKHPTLDLHVSEVVIVGSGLWIDVIESSPDRSRALTTSAVGGLLAELQRYAGDTSSPLNMELLPPSSSIGQSGPIATELRIEGIEDRCRKLPERISGYANAGKEGFLCATIEGDRMNHGLEWCGRKGVNREYLGWSTDQDLKFFYSFPVPIPGPVTPSAYPFKHEVTLNFIPCDGTPPQALGTISLPPCEAPPPDELEQGFDPIAEMLQQQGKDGDE